MFFFLNNHTFLQQHFNSPFLLPKCTFHLIQWQLFAFTIFSSREVRAFCLSHLNNHLIRILCSKSPHLANDINGGGFSPRIRQKFSIFSFHPKQTAQITNGSWLASTPSWAFHHLESTAERIPGCHSRGTVNSWGLFSFKIQEKSQTLCLPGNQISCVSDFSETMFYPRIWPGKGRGSEGGKHCSISYLIAVQLLWKIQQD